MGTGGSEAVVAKHSGRPESGAAGEITRNQGEGGKKTGETEPRSEALQRPYNSHSAIGVGGEQETINQTGLRTRSEIKIPMMPIACMCAQKKNEPASSQGSYLVKWAWDRSGT